MQDHTDAQTLQMTHEDVHEDEVRIEDSPERLEEAQPTMGGHHNVNYIMEEVGGVAGSDNTAEPAGGNFDHPEDEEKRTDVAESEMAQEDYQGEDVTGTDITAA